MGGGRQCICPSSFIANAHNELYALYMENTPTEKNSKAKGGADGRP